MFRLRAKGLPHDPSFPSDLDQLGYYINEHDQVRNIQFPTDPVRYKINKNPRFNDVRNDALNECLRSEVLQRLQKLGIRLFYLPQLTTERPAGVASMPILMTPPQKLRVCDNIILINNSNRHDLGIWSYRVVNNTGTVNAGSFVDLVRDIKLRAGCQEKNVPGLIFTNPCQLLYSYRAGRAMSQQSWAAQPRASALHEAPRVHELNQIPGNKSAAEHLEFVFDKIINNAALVKKDATVYCIGRDDGASALVEHLDKNWTTYSPRIGGLALAEPGYIRTHSDSFNQFLRDRTMAWGLSHHVLNTPLANDDTEGRQPYPLRSSGEEQYADNIIPSAYVQMLQYIQELAQTTGYRNAKMEVPDVVNKEREEIERQLEAPTWDTSDNDEAVAAQKADNNEQLMQAVTASLADPTEES